MSGTGDPADAGTTLIELLVAIAVLALVTMTAFPRLEQGLLAMSRRQAAAAIAARLREVRADALLNDQRRVFAVAADGRSFLSTGYPRAGLPPGVEIAGGSGGVIAFYGDGSSSGGAVFVSAGRRTTPVLVSGATGAVSAAGG